MADLSLPERGSLDGTVQPGRHGREGAAGVALAVRPSGRQTVVLARRGQADALVETCHQRGLALPPPGHASIGRDLTLVATGPGQWLAIGEGSADLASQLLAPLSTLCTLIRSDDGRTLIDVAGADARRALAKMITVDLHPRAFAPSAAAVTVASDVSVVLWQLDEAPRYALAVPRSSSRSFWHRLTESAAEYGYTVDEKGGGAVAAPARGG